MGSLFTALKGVRRENKPVTMETVPAKFLEDEQASNKLLLELAQSGYRKVLSISYDEKKRVYARPGSWWADLPGSDNKAVDGRPEIQCRRQAKSIRAAGGGGAGATCEGRCAVPAQCHRALKPATGATSGRGGHPGISIPDKAGPGHCSTGSLRQPAGGRRRG